MRKKFYIDTSVWLDLLEDRSDGLRPLGEFAFQFFKRCADTDSIVFYSEAIIVELAYFPDFLAEFRNSFRINFVEAIVSDKQVAEAGAIARRKKVPFGDALHAVLARDNGALLVSRDRHFEELQEIVACCSPEKITFEQA